MSDPKALDLEAIKFDTDAAADALSEEGDPVGEDVAVELGRGLILANRRLVAEVERVRLALDGLVKINAEDFPETDGKIDWSAFPVTFGYAKAYRAALVALGREKP